MIEGTVPLTGRKRSLWWVDPTWMSTYTHRKWISPLVLALNVWMASPLLPDPEWERARTGLAGFAFAWVVGYLVDRDWGLGRGAWRVISIGSLATSASTVALTVRDLVQGVTNGASGGVTLAGPRSPQDFATYLFGSLVVGLVLDQVDRRRAREAQQARQLREARDAALRARLAPHFIFNALGTLQAQIEKDPAAATATADALARLFRQALAAAGRPLVPLREELEFVEAYLGIERARLGDRLRVKIDVPEELEEVDIPPLCLQTLVENAIQHGIAPREEGGEIAIRARRSGYGENPGVILSVDNPLAPSSRPGTGNGLETLRGRLASPGDLTVSSSGGAFHAEFWWGTA